MDYKVVERGPMQVMGIELRTTNQNLESMRAIPLFWQRFSRENIRAKIPNQKTGEVLGLYCEYETDENGPYTLVAGCEVTLVGDIPKGLVVKHIPAAKYAFFEIKGKFPDRLMEVWRWIWEGHLDRTFIADFELYPIGFSEETSVDVHLYTEMNSKLGILAAPKQRNSSIVSDLILIILGHLRSANFASFRVAKN